MEARISVLFFALCIFFALCVACTKTDSRAYASDDGAFSYTPPEGWSLRDFPGYKYKIAVTQPSEGFSPNINIVSEPFAGSLDDYIAANQKLMSTQFDKVGMKNYRIVRQSEFQTDLKATGFKMVTESELNEKPLRQIQYFFDGNNGLKFVVTCSTLAGNADGFESLFDKSMRTFKVPV